MAGRMAEKSAFIKAILTTPLKAKADWKFLTLKGKKPS